MWKQKKKFLILINFKEHIKTIGFLKKCIYILLLMWNFTNIERPYLKLQKEAEINIIKFDNFLLNRIKKLVAFLLVYQNILLMLQ